MRKFLKFVHDDVVYCKYYEVVYILFHTGMRISEFCGLTLKDIDLENKTVNIDHQLQRTSDMRYIIETTKTDAGTRVLPITEDVAQMFQAIIEDRNAPKVEKTIDGYSGFLFYDDNGMPLVAMHWQHRFNHMVGRYNDIYRVQMPNITPHVCRHTYCSNMAKSGKNPKTLQYLMGAFGHRRYHEHIHPFGVGGCERRDDSYGGTERCQEGIGKDHWGEACDSEDVQSSIERILI